MPRRRVAGKREILPDPLYGSERLAKFINCVMLDGKKSVAEKVVYGALDKLTERLGSKAKKVEQVESEAGEGESGGAASGAESGGKTSVLDLFKTVLDNIRPTVEVRSRRVGGATYQIPIEVRADRGFALAMRWLVDCAKSRSEKGMMLRLAAEMVDAYEGRGSAVKKREDTHKMAKANQAFAHFRWN